MNELSPEWRSAWQLNDPAWVAERKRKWKGVKSSPAIERLFMPNRDELKKIKNFYLTGSAYDPEPTEEKWRWLSYHPNKRPVPVSSGMLVELWLTADDSKENYQEIYNKYNDSSIRSARNRFRDALHRLYPECGDIFDGRGLRIYQLFGPTRCRMSDYPCVSTDRYNAICASVSATLGMPIYSFLKAGFVDNDGLVGNLVVEWCDSLDGACKFKAAEAAELGRPEFLDVFVLWIQEIKILARNAVNSSTEMDFYRKEVAENILDCLSDIDWISV